MGVNEDIKKNAKDKIIGYLKEKRKENSSPVEERMIYNDLKKEQNLGIIEVMGGIRLIKDVKNNGKDVEITQRQGFIYYKYVGQL